MTIYQFANGTHEQRDDVFKKTAIQLNMPAPIVEKDFWVCWCLKQLFTLPTFGDHMIFNGGTSLSKAYDVIHRFSEDVDLSLYRKMLGFEGDHDPENVDLSGKKQKKLLQELQSAAEVAVAGPVLTELQNIFEIYLKQDFSLTIDKNGAQNLLFSYPLLEKNYSDYINPVVRFEFGVRGVHLPVENIQISSYVHQIFPDLMSKNDINVKVLGIGEQRAATPCGVGGAKDRSRGEIGRPKHAPYTAAGKPVTGG